MLAFWDLKLGHRRSLHFPYLGEVFIFALRVIASPLYKLQRSLNELRRKGILCKQGPISWPQFKSILNIIYFSFKSDTRQLKFYYAFKSFTSESYNSLNCWFFYMPGTNIPTSHLKDFIITKSERYFLCLLEWFDSRGKKNVIAIFFLPKWQNKIEFR